jgi:hypothetical protein
MSEERRARIVENLKAETLAAARERAAFDLVAAYAAELESVLRFIAKLNNELRSISGEIHELRQLREAIDSGKIGEQHLQMVRHWRQGQA